MIHWTPTEGETVHLSPRNPWALPAGRYSLERQPGTHAREFLLRGLAARLWRGIDAADLQQAERAAALTPISQGEIARDCQMLELGARAPLRGHRSRPLRAQHGVADLGLFAASAQLGLPL